MTDDDRDALTAAILDKPDDDIPRLVYADWCDGNAGTEVCSACEGRCGEYRYPADDPTNRLMHGSQWYSCPRCAGSGVVSNGYAERAEFIRAGVSAARAAGCHDDQSPDCPTRCFHRRAAELARMPAPGDDRCAWESWANLPGFACLNLMGDRSADGIDSRLRERGRPPGNYFRFRRGFVSEVHLTLAAFVGGECERCEGDLDIQQVCHVCGGTGRTPGLAPALAAHPLTRVVLTDREPAVSAQHINWFRWYAGDDGAPDTIPFILYDALAGEYPESHHGRSKQPYWRSADAALDALSAACLAYIRSFRPEPCTPTFASDASGG